MDEALYLYGFVARGTPAPPAVLPGVGERVPELLPLGEDFDAVVARLPAAEYGGEALEARLRDLGWVAREGVAHERVVAWFVDHGAIVPVRLFTLYSDEDALRSEAVQRTSRIVDALHRFEALREWDLKVGYRADRLAERLDEVSEEIRTLDEDIAAAAPGRRYLLERQRADRLRIEIRTAARRLADELLSEARSHAEDVRILAPPARLEGDVPVVLSAALLVRRGETEESLGDLVRGRAGVLADLGVDVVFSGPWAPYRFLEEE